VCVEGGGGYLLFKTEPHKCAEGKIRIGNGHRVQADAVCEIGCSTPELSFGDLGMFPRERPNREIVHQQETKDTPGMPFPVSLSWLECTKKEMWVL